MAIEIIAKAENGKANFNDVSELSTQLGNALSRLIAANVTPDKLPNGKLYYNIANTFLTGSLRDNYDLINLTAQAVQESIDNRNGMMIEPQKAEFPADRVHSIVNAVSDETADWSTIERRLDSPVRNVTESFYNDYVEANAEFRSDAGFKPYIIRETDGNCCAWCSSLAGQYEYPNDVPPDVYARHDNCTCTVTYVTDKYRQDVWSKKSYALTPEERKNVLENTPKPERFTRQQAKDVEKSNLKGAVGVANSGKSGIIKLRDNSTEWIQITTQSINSVPTISEFSTVQLNELVRKESCNLLRNLMNDELGTEATVSINLKDLTYKFRKGEKGEGGVKFIHIDAPYISIHNHPSGETFSVRDLEILHSDSKCKTLIVVGNNGKVYIMQKQDAFDSTGFFEHIMRKKYGFSKYNNEYDFMKGAEKYGVKYYERTN